MTINEFQSVIINEINDEKNELQLKVQNNELTRSVYLGFVRERGLKEGLNPEEVEDVVALADRILWGFGIIDDYMNGTIPDVTDIRLIDENRIEVKIKGKREIIPLKFSSRRAYEQFISFITTRNATTISASQAAQVFADITTSDKFIYRYTLVSSLLNVHNSPTLHIRLTPKNKKNMDTLIEEGMLTREQADEIIGYWREGRSILICGPNGSGKTTLENALLDYTPEDKSMAIVGEIPDLFVDEQAHPMTFSRQILPAKTDTAVSYTLEDLCRSCLTESVDILTVSEIKGSEAAQFGYASYTGFQVMSSIHSMSAEDGFERTIDLGVQATGLNRDFFSRQLKSITVSLFVKDYKLTEIAVKGDK